jgi:hypothetical protein
MLTPIRYSYREDNPLNIPNDGEHVGSSAQEVQKVIPEAVSENSNGYLMIDNDPLIWAMLGAIQDQQEIIDTLQVQNDELLIRIEMLEAKLD